MQWAASHYRMPKIMAPLSDHVGGGFKNQHSQQRVDFYYQLQIMRSPRSFLTDCRSALQWIYMLISGLSSPYVPAHGERCNETVIEGTKMPGIIPNRFTAPK